jgi:hypothetical protein
MLETKSAFTLALAGFLAWGLILSISQPPLLIFQLNLSFRCCETQNADGFELTLKLGPQKPLSSSFNEAALRTLVRSLESLRNAAREIYRQHWHLA